MLVAVVHKKEDPDESHILKYVYDEGHIQQSIDGLS